MAKNYPICVKLDGELYHKIKSVHINNFGSIELSEVIRLLLQLGLMEVLKLKMENFQHRLNIELIEQQKGIKVNKRKNHNFPF